jgi:hypothetical protein
MFETEPQHIEEMIEPAARKAATEEPEKEMTPLEKRREQFRVAAEDMIAREANPNTDREWKRLKEMTAQEGYSITQEFIKELEEKILLANNEKIAARKRNIH